MPDLTDFLLYCAYNQNFKYTHLSGSKISCIVNNAAIALIEFYRRTMRKALNESKRFHAHVLYTSLRKWHRKFCQ